MSRVSSMGECKREDTQQDCNRYMEDDRGLFHVIEQLAALEAGRLFGTPVGNYEPRQGQGQGQGQDHENVRRGRAALQLQMVLALTLSLALTLTLLWFVFPHCQSGVPKSRPENHMKNSMFGIIMLETL